MGKFSRIYEMFVNAEKDEGATSDDCEVLFAISKSDYELLRTLVYSYMIIEHLVTGLYSE